MRVAGAMVSPAALSLLTTLYREGPERTRAIGLWQAATAAGATTGIIAVGLLTQLVGWRAIFLVNPPLIAVMLVLVRRMLPTGRPEGSQRLDIPGAVLVTTSLGALIFGLSNGQQHGFGAPATIAALAAAVVLGAGFIGVERRAAAPMLPLAIFAAPTRQAASAAMLLTGAIVAACVYFISLYLQRVLGFSPVATGLSLVPRRRRSCSRRRSAPAGCSSASASTRRCWPASHSPPPASSGSPTSQRAAATS